MSAAYAFYDSYGSVNKQNDNAVKLQNVSEYPRNIYAKKSLNPSRCQPLQYTCQDWARDPDIDYFYPTEVVQHPPHFSRFSYPWCPNGYCVGNHPGRYNTPAGMRWMTEAQPDGMAPQKFYSGSHVDPNYVSSPAYVDSQIIRNAI